MANPRQRDLGSVSLQRVHPRRARISVAEQDQPRLDAGDRRGVLDPKVVDVVHPRLQSAPVRDGDGDRVEQPLPGGLRRVEPEFELGARGPAPRGSGRTGSRPGGRGRRPRFADPEDTFVECQAPVEVGDNSMRVNPVTGRWRAITAFLGACSTPPQKSRELENF
jgi:hypothetical protein